MEEFTIAINELDLATMRRGAQISNVSLESFVVISAVREAHKLQSAELLLDSVFLTRADRDLLLNSVVQTQKEVKE